MGGDTDGALERFRGALAQRTRYLIGTGELSQASANEMQALSEQMATLDSMLGSSLALRRILVGAYTREVRRRRVLVVRDARRERARGQRLRDRAGSVKRAVLRGRLRVVPDRRRLDLTGLQRLGGRWGRTG